MESRIREVFWRKASDIGHVCRTVGERSAQTGGARTTNFQFPFLITVNGARSNYNAAQLQYRGQFARGLQGLLNYTWSHSLDNASDDVTRQLSNAIAIISGANDYGSSNFDVRHSFSGA